MIALLARLLGGAVSPLVDRVSTLGASLARKLALFLVAGLCFLVVLGSLTIAFDLWIASLAGAIVGALAVAGVYLAIGILALVAATRGSRKAASAGKTADAPAAESATARDEQIDRFTAPLLKVLQSLGLQREQLAVFAGATVAKKLRPLPLIGVAIVAGFLLGRVWKGWDALLSTDLAAALLGIFGLTPRPEPDVEDQAA